MKNTVLLNSERIIRTDLEFYGILLTLELQEKSIERPKDVKLINNNNDNNNNNGNSSGNADNKNKSINDSNIHFCNS